MHARSSYKVIWIMSQVLKKTMMNLLYLIGQFWLQLPNEMLEKMGVKNNKVCLEYVNDTIVIKAVDEAK